MNLSLLQLGDSALPIGGYSHSWGLEAAIDCRLVRDPASLEQWARDWLKFAVGPFEGVIVAAVCRAVSQHDWPTVQTANELLQVSLTPPTLRLASRDMGLQLLSLCEAWPWAADAAETLRQLDSADWHHAVVFATLAATAGATEREALLVYLHQSALSVVSAGVRTVPIGHTHGQQVIARLHGAITMLADSLLGRDLHSAGSCCPNYEVLCHAQSQLYTRLFRS
jgi:urease accessory protein